MFSIRCKVGSGFYENLDEAELAQTMVDIARRKTWVVAVITNMDQPLGLK